MSVEDVKSNYNAVGIAVIEMMYSGDYLSIGGLESTETLAAEAKLRPGSSVLDVGSGLGGPAIYLAESRGCRVTGLDLVELNVQQARERAEAKELGQLVEFQQGDATQMPFSDEQFEVVWGQDAWCHVGDKTRLIQECSRVLKPGGTIAFTDWLETGEMDAAYRETVLSASASPALQSLDGYAELLSQNGFTGVTKQDISDTFISQYREIIKRLADIEPLINEKFSPKVYQIVAAKNRSILDAFEGRKMGGGRFIGTKPS